MTKAAEFCCLLGLEHALLVLLHYHQLSVFQLLHCLSLAILELVQTTDIEGRDRLACLLITGIKSVVHQAWI